MKKRALAVFRVLFSTLSLALLPAVSLAQPTQVDTGRIYTLIEGSQIVDDCPICDRIPIVRPLRGTFTLRLLEQNPLATVYAVENISWVAGDSNGPRYKVSGKGIYSFGGEVAYRQDLFLDVQISNGFSVDAATFTNALPGVSRPWPMLQVSVDQTNGTPAKQYHLDLNAAPFREIWFSTVKGFTAGAWNPPTNALSAGDFLSGAGRLVKANRELTSNLGIQPIVADLGLKDVDVLPGGEVAFSLEQDVFSERLGTLSHGDLLSDRGRILYRNAQLLAKLLPMPPIPPEIGLAAVQLMNQDEVFFSVQTGFFSESLGVAVAPGDLLSSAGKVVRTGQQLIAPFKPASPKTDYGLAAVFLWPTNEVSRIGEIWFTTRDGFYDASGGYYAAGDLLSDQGYVVYRNEELLAPFAKTEAGTLDLDALYVFTGAPPAADITAAMSSKPVAVGSADGIRLQWSGGGRVFQVERATAPQGPFSPASAFLPADQFLDAGILTNSSQAYYRIRQW